MKETSNDLIKVMGEFGYKQITSIEKGFKALNWFNEERIFRLDILGSNELPFYNIVAVGVESNDDDIIKPIQLKHIEKTVGGAYAYIVTTLDIVVNKTEEQLKETGLS